MLTDDIVTTLETKRKGHVSFFYSCAGFAVFCILLLMFMGDKAPIFRGPSIGLIILLAGVLLFWAYHILEKNYHRRTKVLLMTGLAQKMKLSYSPSKAFDINSVLHHGILPPFEFCKTEDGFTTNFRSPFPMEFQEIRLSRKEFDEPQQTTRIIQFFRGLVIRIHLRQKLEYQTVILPNRFLRPSVDVGNLPAKRGLEPVNIVSNKFSKSYKLYSGNQVEARTVFDPAFIERFMELGDHLNAEWMDASFKGRELLITLHFKKDFFEIGSLLKPVTEESLGKTIGEVQHILGIADILKHNMYLGQDAYRKLYEK